MNAAVPENSALEPGRWEASLDLGFSARSGRTVLSTFRHRGPLTVQRPFYPEGNPCHVYVLHPPGGIVGGDKLTIHATAEPSAHGLITTPGAGKFYRSGGRQAEVSQRIQASAGAALEWFPQETIVFDGAQCAVNTRIDLEKDADCIGWDILCFGRPASNDLFQEGHVSSRLHVSRDNVPLLIEALKVENSADLRRSSGQRGYMVTALFFAANCSTEELEAARKCLSADKSVLCGATLLDDLLVVRGLGNAVEAIRALFLSIWRKIRPVLLGRDACPPRIWST